MHTDYEAKLSKALPDYVKILTKLEVEPPFLLYLGLVNVYGWFLRREQHRTNEFAFDTGLVTAPAVMVSEPGFSTDRALLELFNVIWQAVGEEKSPRDNGGKIEPICASVCMRRVVDLGTPVSGGAIPAILRTGSAGSFQFRGVERSREGRF